MLNSLTRLKNIEDKVGRSDSPEGMAELLEKVYARRQRRRDYLVESGQIRKLKDEYLSELSEAIKEAKDAVKWMLKHPEAKDSNHKRHRTYWLCSIRGINIDSDLKKTKQDITNETIDNHFDGSHREPEYIEKMITEGKSYEHKLSVM